MIITQLIIPAYRHQDRAKTEKLSSFFLEETENGRKKPTNNRHLNKPGSTNQLKLLTLNHPRT
jgi:hypothetical protein